VSGHLHDGQTSVMQQYSPCYTVFSGSIRQSDAGLMLVQYQSKVFYFCSIESRDPLVLKPRMSRPEVWLTASGTPTVWGLPLFCCRAPYDVGAYRQTSVTAADPGSLAFPALPAARLDLLAASLLALKKKSGLG